MKRKVLHNTIWNIVVRVSPASRRAGIIGALLFGIGVSVPFAVSRTVYPAPTKTEQRARQQRHIAFEFAAMLVWYLGGKMKKRWHALREVWWWFDNAMGHFCEKEVGGKTFIRKTDVFYMVDFILRSMTEQERNELVDSVMEHLNAIEKQIVAAQEITVPELREERIKECITNKYDVLGQIIKDQIDKNPGMKELIENILAHNIKYKPELFMRQIQKETEKGK